MQYIVLLVFIIFSGFAFAETVEFEDATNLRAKDVLPKDLRKGAHYTVERQVRSDGYLNYYTIDSDFGQFEAISTSMLKTRVGEINALAELEELSKTEVFLKAAADAGVGQIKALTQFATNPVETVVGIPSGIGRMFKRYKRQAGDAVDSTKEFVAGDDDAASNHASQTSGNAASVGEIWLLGSASTRTKDELVRLGFTVHDQVAAMIVMPAT